ncbi:MAG TPA: HAD family hydrolase [Acidimicrobiales bacterium]|jgi:HAD superfamily hydrolase (TIGR01509 family)|nr:HAD family hydrolase [Acidimicrobiales bacterium]
MPDLRPGVLLDMDGTLLDTNYLHTLAWSRGLADAGEWAPMHAIHRLIGMGGGTLMKSLLGHENHDARDSQHRHYDELKGEIRAFPGARELLRALHGAGLAVVLATSAPQDDLDAMRKVLSAEDAIDAVTGADDVDESKPAPDIFLAALRAGGVDPRLCLVVGDSVWDVEAADAAGVACVGVESGGFSRHELMEAGAMHVYRDVQQLLDHLRTGPFAPLLAAARGGQPAG